MGDRDVDSRGQRAADFAEQAASFSRNFRSLSDALLGAEAERRDDIIARWLDLCAALEGAAGLAESDLADSRGSG